MVSLKKGRKFYSYIKNKRYLKDMQYFKLLQNPNLYRGLTREMRSYFSSENKLADEFASQLHNLKTAKKPGAITNIFSNLP